MKIHSFEEPNALQQLRENPTSRRAFLKTMGAAGLGLVAVSLLDGCGGGNDDNNGGGGGTTLPAALQQYPGTGDQKILNYALSLEYLETSLYRQALNLASGRPLTQALDTNSDNYKLKVSNGSLSTNRAQDGFDYLVELAYVEPAHANFLEATLNSLSAPKVVPNAAGYTFVGLNTASPSMSSIMNTVLPIGENGVRAYLGAGRYFQSLALLQGAVSLYSVEARHAAAVNFILDRDIGPYTVSPDSMLVPLSAGTSSSLGVSSNTFERYREPATVLQLVDKYINKTA